MSGHLRACALFNTTPCDLIGQMPTSQFTPMNPFWHKFNDHFSTLIFSAYTHSNVHVHWYFDELRLVHLDLNWFRSIKLISYYNKPYVHVIPWTSHNAQTINHTYIDIHIYILHDRAIWSSEAWISGYMVLYRSIHWYIYLYIVIDIYMYIYIYI